MFPSGISRPITNIDWGLVGPEATGAIGLGAIGLGATGMGVTGLGATGMGVTGMGVTGLGVTGLGVTGAIGMGATGSTGSGYLHTSSNLKAGFEFNLPPLEKKNILSRFYKLFAKITTNQDMKTPEDFFSIESQIQKDPKEYLENNDLYKYGIKLFYNLEKIPDELWIRNGSQIFQIKIEKNLSGSIYQNPFYPENGLLLVGHCQDFNSNTMKYCFFPENEKFLIVLEHYYFHRTQCILNISDSIFQSKIEIKENLSNTKPLKVVSSILSGELADVEIECLDGKVLMSKSILSLYSEYFLLLFTNSLSKEKFYKLEFTKNILIYYLYYCLQAPIEFDIHYTKEYIEFGDFIQDKYFLQYIYSKIYLNREVYCNTSLLEIMNIYEKLGFSYLDGFGLH